MDGAAEPENPSSGVKPGEVLAGKYRVERVLGEGGMGVVVAAHHLKLDEKVALKFLLPSALKNVETVGRFAREARAAVKIKSEHVARVIDVGELDNGSPYIVMEYLEGLDLAASLARGGPMAIEQSVGFILQACEAIAEAHALGIVHRDLKPANLFLANRPSGPPIVKVLDFGISKAATSASQPQLTKTSAIMGSPLYMSPEQILSSKNVDARADIWALGVILYELVSGKVPFPGEEMPQVIGAVLYDVHEPLRAIRADVPPGFEAVVHRCLAKSPSERFDDVGQLAAALAPFGPPRSEVSVERISHVLGLKTKAGGSSTLQSDPPVVVSAGQVDTSGHAKTQADSGPGPGAALVTAAVTGGTTGTPVTNDPAKARRARAFGSPSPALATAVVVAFLGAGALVAWRLVSSPPIATDPSRVSASGAAAASDPGVAPSATATAEQPVAASTPPAAPPDPAPQAPATASATPVPQVAQAPSAALRPAPPPRSATSAPHSPAPTASASADPFGLHRK